MTKNKERAKLLLEALEAELELLKAEDMNSCRAGYAGRPFPTGLGEFDPLTPPQPENNPYSGYYPTSFGNYGGGDGRKSNPYTQTEFNNLHTNPSFKGGWVKDNNGNMHFGYKNGDKQNDMNDHWKKVGKYDIDNCSECSCGIGTKGSHLEPSFGNIAGQTLNHSNHHKNEYYNHYGECEQDRKRPKKLYEKILGI